jgi:hypothetical protein
MRSSRDAWDQFCADIGRLCETGRLSEEQLEQLSQEAEALYEAGLLSDDRVERLTDALISPDQRAFIEALAYGLAKIFHTPLGLLKEGAQDVLLKPVDQLAAEAQEHKTASALLKSVPGLVGRGIVLQNPHDPPNCWYGAYEVRVLRGYPLPQLPHTIDGYPVKIVVVDSPPVAY